MGSPGVPQIFVNNNDVSDSSSQDRLPGSGLTNPKRPQLGVIINPADNDIGDHPHSGISPRAILPGDGSGGSFGGASPGQSMPGTPQLLSPTTSPWHSPVHSPMHSPVSVSPETAPMGRAGSAQSVLEEALDASEWGRQIRSYVARSPSNAGLRNRSTSGTRVRDRSRSPSSPGGFHLS